MDEREGRREERAIAIEVDYELRSVPDSAMPRFVGYAAVFNVDSEPMPFIETIHPDAFSRSLQVDRTHTFVMDHDDAKLLASRKAGTLTLTADSKGLLAEASLPNTDYARNLVELHGRGEARAMSFTFGVKRNSRGEPGEMWSADGKRRTLTNLALGHVTVLTGQQPAYRQTTASIRSLARRLGAEADEVEDVLDAIRTGAALDMRAVDLLQSVIAELREQPAPEPEAIASVPLSIRQLQLALAAKAR